LRHFAEFCVFFYPSRFLVFGYSLQQRGLRGMQPHFFSWQ